MRDHPDEPEAAEMPDAAAATAAPAAAQRRDEPRGRDALDLSPKGMFYDFVLEPMKGRGVDLAYRATCVALTVSTGVVLVLAVWSATP